MDRGPLALFGAIVAVGLGPALWLGVQVGSVEILRDRPPVVREQNQGGPDLIGGAGAGEKAGNSEIIHTTPEGNVLPVSKAPVATGKARPTRTPSEDPSPSVTASRTPDPTASPSTTPSSPAPSADTSSGSSGNPSSSATPPDTDPPTGGSPSTPPAPGGGASPPASNGPHGTTTAISR